MPAHSRDRLFLFACSVSGPDDWNGREHELQGLGPADWEALRDDAVFHGFAGLLARNFGWAGQLLGRTLPIVEPLATLRRGQLVQHLNRKAAARRVGEALEAEKIPFIAFKGVALAEEVYGDLSVRGFRDFDVMVPLDRVEDAWRVVCAMGYRAPQFGHVREWMQHGAHAVGMAHLDGTGVDLHWSIAPDMLDPAQIAFVWKHTRRPEAGPFLPGLRLSPEMTLLHLAKHFHSHQYGSVKALVDFHVAARKFGARLDWPQLRDMAREMRLLAVVEIAAALCERAFVPVALPSAPGSPGRGLQARLAVRILDDRFLVHSGEMPRLTNWLRYLLVAGSGRATLQSLRDFLVPGKLMLVQFFGRPFEPRMYPLYYWRQLRKVLTLSAK